MSLSGSSPPATPARPAPRPLWTFALNTTARGLVLAREKGYFLAWDDSDWLYLIDRAGHRQGQFHAPGKIAAAAAADDGSAYALASGETVSWLAPDLMPRWERQLGRPVQTVAVDPLGQYLAAADAGGRLLFFDRTGQRLSEGESPRPFQRMAFVPEAALLVGCADFGLVACYDLTGRCVWRDGLVVHLGGVAVSGDGQRIAFACYTDGLRFYSLAGKPTGRMTLREPCRYVCLSYPGDRVLVADVRHRVYGLEHGGGIDFSWPLDRALMALALSPLGNQAAVALADGRIVLFELPSHR